MATIIVGMSVAFIVFLIIRKLYKDKKSGKSACGCKCQGCPNSQICHCNLCKEYDGDYTKICISEK